MNISNRFSFFQICLKKENIKRANWIKRKRIKKKNFILVVIFIFFFILMIFLIFFVSVFVCKSMNKRGQSEKRSKFSVNERINRINRIKKD
jgi:uncharacterized membrane protein YvbJ